MHSSVSVALLSLLPAAFGLYSADGVGKLPALGWNQWNAFGCQVSAAIILNQAKYFGSLGLQAAGYEYVNIDDCWQESSRDSKTGEIVANTRAFPNGIAGLASSVHALGLKLGIYSDAGNATCSGFPASLDHEALDAATFAAWGVDYLKYDNCNVPTGYANQYTDCNQHSPTGPNGTCTKTSSTAPSGYNWGTSKTAIRYRQMRDALLAQNRTILFSMCDWGQEQVSTWGNATGHSWRMGRDIAANWGRLTELINQNTFMANYNNFYGHPDMDMLEVGSSKITMIQSRSHFAMWAIMKSPLIIGQDLSTMSATYVNILKNKYLLAFNQDPVYGAPAIPYKWGTYPDWTFNNSSPAEYWSGMSTNGTMVVLFNPSAGSSTKAALWAEVPQLKGGSSYQVTDVWTDKSLGCVATGVTRTLEAYDTAVLLVGNKC